MKAGETYRYSIVGSSITSANHNDPLNEAEWLTVFAKQHGPPFYLIAESKSGTNPYFATGAGGVLQAVLNGFGGLEITPAGIMQIKSVLPGQWKSLTLKGIGVEKKTFTVK